MLSSMEKNVREIQEKYGVVGRSKELKAALLTILKGKHLLIEGDVGVGKTTLAMAISNYLKRPLYRIDASEVFDSTKLIGWFDPPLVLKKGYCWESFIKGPLTEAMLKGGILFINEINRLPEDTQNVLLPVMDEKKLVIPKLGDIESKKGFVVVATQNPEAYIGATLIGEALKDRFVWLKLNYQSEDEEVEIVKQKVSKQGEPFNEEVVRTAVRIVRKTREHKGIERGSSIRGAIDLAEIVLDEFKNGPLTIDQWVEASVMALSTKIEIKESLNKSAADLIKEIVLGELGLKKQETRFLWKNP